MAVVKDRQMNIKVSKTEAEMFRRAAHAAQLPMSEFVRRAATKESMRTLSKPPAGGFNSKPTTI